MVNLMVPDSRVLVLLPAHNEARHIAGLVLRVRALGYPVVVLDDGSDDATASESEKAGAVVLRHACNLGLCATLQTGYAYALERHFDVVAQVDGDGQHEVADIPLVLAPVLDGTADLALGSRFLGTGDYAMPVLRRWGSALFRHWLACAGLRVSDPTSGFQALNRATLAMCVSDAFPDDFPDANFLLLAARQGLRVREVPVRMYPNHEGRSIHNGLLKPLIYLVSMSLSLIMIELRHRFGRRRSADVASHKGDRT